MTMLLILPSRGDPDRLRDAINVVRTTAVDPFTLMLSLDMDDDTVEADFLDELQARAVCFAIGERRPTLDSVNEIAVELADDYDVVGYVTTAFRRRAGWDREIALSLKRMPRTVSLKEGTGTFSTGKIVAHQGYLVGA